jgi:DNA-directed RNA polymerase subunit RPC12/RpoP
MYAKQAERLITGGHANWIYRHLDSGEIEWQSKDNYFSWLFEGDVVLNYEYIHCSYCRVKLEEICFGERWMFLKRSMGVTNVSEYDLYVCSKCLPQMKPILMEKMLKNRDSNMIIPVNSCQIYQQIVDHRHFNQLPVNVVNFFKTCSDFIISCRNMDLLRNVWFHLYHGECLVLNVSNNASCY